MRPKPPGLPDSYDINKEPSAPHRLRKVRGERRSLSGYGYVVVLMNGDQRAGMAMVATEANCDHCTTICSGTVNDGQSLCADEWQYDYAILWSRTAAGRNIISAIGTDRDRFQNPDHPAAKFNRAMAEQRD